MHAPATRPLDRNLKLAILVAGLGYFVDIFDLTLFSILRVPSLKALGLDDAAILSDGVFLLNMQMAGLLIGGVIWGIIGDRIGRIQVLFGSILLYSLANLANAFVQDVSSYALLRFIAGIGLAGEIGAGITLVAELMPKEKRGLATTFVASVGVAGAVAGGLLAQVVEWRTAYIAGGVMGLLLLAIRAGVKESGLFENIRQHHGRADLRLLLSRDRLPRYISCILIGVPIWFFVGIVVTFSPEIGRALNMQAPLVTANGIMFTYLGLTFGDMASGVLSQYMQSRRRAVATFMAGSFVLTALCLLLEGGSPATFYGLCLVAGFFLGYWALMLTTATEQFGTNLRATVTSTVPNFVRGSTILLTLAFSHLKGSLGVLAAAQLVGAVVFALAALALLTLRETFHSDLDFSEKK